MLKKIADAGLLVALLNRQDEFHRWAGEVFEFCPKPQWAP